MVTPRLLDLFSGAGGCSVGYHRAGFEVVGVDIEAHRDYPYRLIIANAMAVLEDRAFLSGFDVIHASPPCPRYSSATKATGTWRNHPDLVPAVRAALRAHGGPYVIENVPGAPMPEAVVLCGWAMGLTSIKRHRLFESDLLLMSPGCGCPHSGAMSVFGHASDLWINGVRTHVPFKRARALMGVEWMTRREDMADAIPPAYTEYIGAQLLDQLTAAA